MVGTHQIIAALPPPTQDQWTETLSLELSRSQLFCLLSVVGYQASNIGKELLERWQNQPVLSSELVYSVLSDYNRVSVETGARISCAVIVFRGTRTTIASLRAGVRLRRGELAKVVVGVSDGVEIREGSSQAHDLYILHSELANHQSDKLLLNSKYPDQITKSWQEIKVGIIDSANNSEGWAVCLVLPNDLINSNFGRELLRIDMELTGSVTTEFASYDNQRAVESNRLQQRRISRVNKLGIRKKVNLKIDQIGKRLLRKNSVSPENNSEPKLPTSETEHNVDSPIKPISTNDELVGLSSVQESPIKPVGQSKLINLSDAVKGFWLRVTSRKSVFVGHQFNRRKVFFLIGICILIIITLASLFFINKNQKRETQVAIEKLQPFQESLNSIRILSETDLISARAQAQNQLVALGNLQNDSSFPSSVKDELDNLLNQTKSLYESLAVLNDLSTLPTFDDLRKISPAFLASTASGDGSQGILADRDQQLLITYNTLNKNGQTVDAANLEKLVAVSQQGDQSYVLGNGIWQLNSPTANELTQLLPSSTQTEAATQIASFGSNVYVFNPSLRAFYRYVLSGSTLSSPTNWLTGAVPFSYANVTSVVVDGQVWFGTNLGEVYRFAGGKQTDFSIAGLDQPLSSTVYLATNEDAKELAILEPASKRLIILNKDTGLVSREFVNDNLGSATGLWLDDGNNQVMISSGAALYNILINDSAP